MRHRCQPPTLRREPGQRVGGRFRIEQQLAEGGMGVVFRARDERTGSEIALKQLRAQAGMPPSALAALGVQFAREYHTLCQLSHPCIIQVFDYGVDEGGAYYTMELLRGQDLRQRGKLPWREACAVLRDVASSLAILHSRRLLHRDVTARNVFCIEGGRSKLIDFGAMMTMGVAKHLVGTPPFIPLEALQQQSLDGRADLYSLGAVAYWVLTGSYAYSARSLGELKSSFATPPPGLRQHDPALPEALDVLVMSLLQLDRTARPSSAAEVMERLSGIAGIALEEHAEVGRSYLSMPTLVGRDAVLDRVRVDLVAGRRGSGTSLLLEGSAGSGRSRMLDACVLTAKLHGAVVLRSDASDAAGGAYGVARALGLQLIDALPDEARTAVGSEGAKLAAVLPELWPLDVQGSARAGVQTPRAELQAAMRDLFTTVARDKHLVIVVDDVERADEPSAALLGALAYAAGRRQLNLLLSVMDDAAPSAALSVLRAESRTLALEPLQEAQTEQLLGSVFGEVPHLSALAGRIHTIAGGSPSVTMALAEHLVAEKIARYEAGSWALPEQLLDEQLPKSAGAALIARIEGLSAEARDLAEVLALTQPETIAPELYPRLAEGADPSQGFRALDALTATGVLTLVGDRYRFTQFDAGAALERQLEPARKRALHARLATVLEGSAREERIALHLLRGGQEHSAIGRILTQFGMGAPPGAEGTQLLQEAFEAGERLALPLRTRMELRTLLLQAAGQAGHYSLFAAHADALVERLELDSGLFDHAQLPTELESATRVQQALRRAAERREATPPSERGFAPGEVAAQLFRVYGAFISMSGISQDFEMLARLPRVEPLVGQFPLLDWLRNLIDIHVAHRQGRNTATLALANALVERVAANTNPAFAFIAQLLRLSTTYLLSMFAATSGQQKTLALVSELERVPGQRGNAWRVRMVYELMLGNMEAARACQRRSELLNLQDGGQLQFPGTTVRTELMAYMHSDDLLGMKRITERIAQFAHNYPGWRSSFAVARCHYRRLQGDPAGALTVLEPVLQMRAGDHMDWWLVAYSHIRVLTDADRIDDAIVAGQHYVDAWAREQLSAVDYGLQQATADALLRAGRHQDALEMMERYLDGHQRAGTRGLRLGLAYETRARIAIAMRDDRAAQEYTRLCAGEYMGGRHGALLNRYAKLVREADAGGVVLSTDLRVGAAAQPATVQGHTMESLHSQFYACAGPVERAEAALRLLLETTGARLGYLYGLRERALVLLAPAQKHAPDGLEAWLHTCMDAELQRQESTTIDTGENDDQQPQRFVDPEGRQYEALLLHGRHAGTTAAGGMLVLHFAPGRRTPAPRTTVEAVTQLLISDGMMEPMAL